MSDIWGRSMSFDLSGGLDGQNMSITLALVLTLLLASRFKNILDTKGSIAAGALGLVVGVLGHWSWLVILLAFLLSSHKATKLNWGEKSKYGFCESIDGSRGWYNVAANGSMPAIIAIYSFTQGNWGDMLWIFTASVAVATSDTWASEIGCLDKRVWMITTMKKCEPGVNGGISINGQFAAIAGSALIGIVALAAGWLPAGGDLTTGITMAAIVSLIGWLGCQMDSLLGAVFENRGLMTKGSVNAASIAFGVIVAWFIFL
ncbi:MAG: DUF92 domain-containing protein [Euryarchaeota archaeon]|nr:DUF92 domain-containing protein [Euryarchaeota archaeon]MBT4407514.1 DUF92 domain-containing protein [Euryarchaeota archaeon]MBT6645614.1 DUF92 domain-containing protein [Euryarchaeota archaeon]